MIYSHFRDVRKEKKRNKLTRRKACYRQKKDVSIPLFNGYHLLFAFIPFLFLLISFLFLSYSMKEHTRLLPFPGHGRYVGDIGPFDRLSRTCPDTDRAFMQSANICVASSTWNIDEAWKLGDESRKSSMNCIYGAASGCCLITFVLVRCCGKAALMTEGNLDIARIR